MLAEYSHLIGGLSGGIVSTLICHPLDLLRIRYAVDEGKEFSIRPQYRSYWHAFRTIIKSEGIRGAYQGLTPTLIAAPLGWGLYFHIYHKIHARLVDSSDPNKQYFLSNFLIGCLTGGCVMAMTNPLWVTKTRLCLQYENSTKVYSGMIDCLRKIYKFEGIRGLYRGFIPALFGTINGSIQFACYNFMKDYRCSSLNLPLDHKLQTMDYLVFSSVSKMISVMSTYPYQVIRARLQDHNTSYKGVRDCLMQTWRREGIIGMYKGALMATVKQTPAGIITYVVYEHSKRFAERF